MLSEHTCELDATQGDDCTVGFVLSSETTPKYSRNNPREEP